MDLKNWEKRYSFLENVLKLFREFNDNVIYEDKAPYSSCNTINLYDNENRTKYKYFCMKLIRNIWSIYDVAEGNTNYTKLPIEYMNYNQRCDYLNKWIWYYIMKENVPDHIITYIFSITHKMISANPDGYKCKCELLSNEFFDPHKIIKLSLLENNYYTILDILKNKGHNHYAACHKFVSDCVNTYQKLNTEHCTPVKKHDAKNVKTCKQLESFKELYNKEIYEKLSTKENAPDLETFQMDPKEELLLEKEDSYLYYAGKSELMSSSPQHNSTIGAVITVGKGAGITAGTGAILLALYKFTPIGSWFHSGKGRKKRVGNFLEEGPAEELYLNNPDYMHMNSDTMSYNVGYSQT
ncbi:VIR protein [Plasmodium vivax]|uniref:VIR protein n=1 Tax=Plasmodium vivax TaxID=5855 RepID=A0A1G4GS94_PLAVI|nr:VIR protein [Plasmodium vivax]